MDLRIGICDDKPEWLEKAGDTVKRCAEQMQKKVEMYFFQNGSELRKEETSQNAYSVYGYRNAGRERNRPGHGSEPEMAGMPDYLSDQLLVVRYGRL